MDLLKLSKNLSIAFSFILIASCSSPKHSPAQDDEFRSMIRLWSAHHLDDTLNSQLMSALQKYPGACDEVWFYFQNEYGLPIEERLIHREKLAKAADKMRNLGIIVSAQTVTIDHPNGKRTSEEKNNYGFRPMTGPDGRRAATQSCPRDTAFLNFQAWNHAFYSEAFKPEAIYIDDDLRITQHSPVDHLCFCDSCIAQFNAQFGYSYSRETLVDALIQNVDGVRDNWVTFSQESLALVARHISRAVHEVSPSTHMGLQHVNFHGNLLEGRDWNKIFDAMEQETGLVPVSRPGHGFYNDHAPRGMIEKAYGISRQIARLNKNITTITPEIEGSKHKATGKSPQCIATETMLYLSMGATSMSYAIICGNNEPMSWYADNYFKTLDKHHTLFKEYAAHNKGTLGGGIDSYISQNHINRNIRPGEDAWAWSVTDAGAEIITLAPLGIPFTPEGGHTTATVLDLQALYGMTDSEIISLAVDKGIIMDTSVWNEIASRGLAESFKQTSVPEGIYDVKCFESSTGRHIAVVPKFTADITNAERLNTLRIYDWASDGKMAAVLESMAQAVVVPRVTKDGVLKSVLLANVTISDLPSATLRLRGCPANCRLTWQSVDKKRRLKPIKDGNDLIVTIPQVKAWNAGWIKVE